MKKGLNLMCIICYKTLNENIDDGFVTTNFDMVNKFYKFCSRLCSNRIESFNTDFPTVVACKACIIIVDSFNDLNHQIHCIQLQLDWQLNKLKNVMECADKIPSRVKAFRKRYQTPATAQPNQKDFRKQIKSQVEKHLSKAFPRVRLKNIVPVDNHLSPSANPLKSVHNTCFNGNDNFLLGWISTFIAVAFCYFPNESNSIDRVFDDDEDALSSISSVSVTQGMKSEPGIKTVWESEPIPMFITDCNNLKKFEQSLHPEDDLSHLFSIEDSHDYHHQPNLCLISDATGQNVTENFPSALSSIIPSSSRQLRSKFKCVNCNQTFSSLARLDVHKTSCALQVFNELDNEENATTALPNDMDDGGLETSNFESDEEMGQYKIENPASDLFSMEEDSDRSSDLGSSENDTEYEKQKSQKTQQRRSTRIYKNRLIKQINDLKLQANKDLEELTRIYKQSNGLVELSKATVTELKLTGANVLLKDLRFQLQVCNIGGCEPSLFLKDDLVYHQRLHGNFQCSFCEFNSNFAPTLITHELEHDSDNQDISCPKCLNVKIDKINYKTHFLQRHLEPSGDWPPVKCPVCFMSFPNEDSVPLTHFVNQHDLSRLNDPETAYKCDEENCSAYFLTIPQATAHAFTIHNKTKKVDTVNAAVSVYSCHWCPSTFTAPSLLLLHVKAIHPIFRKTQGNIKVIMRIDDLVEKRNAKFYCPVDSCMRKYFSQSELDIHSKLHSNFKCKFCPVAKTWATDLAIHELDHNKIKDGFSCKRCSFRSIRQNPYLFHHLEKHLKVSPDKIKCPDCQKGFHDLGEKFMERRSLKRAMHDHHIIFHYTSNGMEELTDMYKKSNGQVELSEANVKSLKINGADIWFNEVEYQLEVCHLEGCEPGLFSPDDLNYHKKMHGQFKCLSCEFNCKFAPTLITHELGHLSNQSEFSCPKCTDLKMEKMDYKKHCLEYHLDERLKLRDTKCPLCSMSFTEDQVPLVHFVNEHDLNRLDDPEKVEKCNEENCSAYFLTGKQLIDHSQIVHNKTKKFLYTGTRYTKLVECEHTCDVCQMKFCTFSDLNLHKQRVHTHSICKSSKPGNVIIADDGMTVDDFVTKRHAKFLCPKKNCKEKYFTENERESHVKLHGNFKCNFCPIVKTFAPDLAVHELDHTKIDQSCPPSSRISYNYNCCRCTFSSKFKNAYVSHHLEIHLNVLSDKIKCHICGMIFYDKPGEGERRRRLLNQSVLSHFLGHHDKSKLEDKTALFNCGHCPAYFLTGHQLHMHNFSIHSEQSNAELSLSCDDCNKQFTTRLYVLMHRLKVHHKHDNSKYEFMCEVTNCQKRFEYKGDLDRHLVLHSMKVLSTNTCPECGKNVMGRAGFVRHVRSHHIANVCDQCGKKFPNKRVLAIHLLSHSGPDSWEFVCEVCSKKCLTKGKLNEHMRIHTKVKPFICDKCGVRYAHRHNWRHHMSNKHGVKVPTGKFNSTVNMTSQKGIKRKRSTV